MIGNIGEFGYRPMDGLIHWRPCGLLLFVNWIYKTNATLTLFYSSSAVHAGLQDALQDFHGGREFLLVPVCSESWFNVALASGIRSCRQPS